MSVNTTSGMVAVVEPAHATYHGAVDQHRVFGAEVLDRHAEPVAHEARVLARGVLVVEPHVAGFGASDR